MNFARGFPMACVSIALWNGMQPVLGVIKDVFSKSIFTGIVGEKPFIAKNPSAFLRPPKSIKRSLQLASPRVEIIRRTPYKNLWKKCSVIKR